ncbi:MAG: hypothetical protein OXR68_00170 [Alphaproteobacteria bacterium]|nr:hypothetical protein [Alphaproteobacteria bacterium]MDD9919026.1 hypothetical protein [Alphaproteobacteria bacterium]
MADVNALKQHVCKLASTPPFIHHDWFVDHHLSIIESIVEELLGKYPKANKTVCRAMVWIHDLGKIITNKGPDEEEVTFREINNTLPKFGFSSEEIRLIAQAYREMEELKPQGEDFLIETKIISSADAFSHYIGPFFSLHWREHPNKEVDALVDDNLRKIKKDEGKIMLPEVMEAARLRMDLLAENHPKNRVKNYLEE